jgi:aspartate kinase
MKVLKFGGSSVRDAKRIEELLKFITPGETQLVVLSAVSGVTDMLERLNILIKQQRNGDGLQFIYEVSRLFEKITFDLFSENPLSRAFANVEIQKMKNFLLDTCHRAYYDQRIDSEVLAVGEQLTTKIFYELLKSRGIEVELLYSPDFIRLGNDGDPDVDFLSNKLRKVFDDRYDARVVLMQGFICSDATGALSNLKRGGSDYTASLAGAALGVDEIQIWTDMDGMHNNDPRFVDNTSPVESLSYNEAAELAYFGAKILHPQTIYPAMTAGIPVRIKNTMNPAAQGTLVESRSPSNGVKAVAAKNGIVQIKIRSGRMLMAYGFLSKLFRIFEKNKTPIDMLTSSEVSVSLTIDDTSNLQLILDELRQYGELEVYMNQVIICIVGDFLKNHYGRALSVLDSLKEVPVSMISYGGSNNSISILVDQKDKLRALNNLQEGLFQTEEIALDINEILMN